MNTSRSASGSYVKPAEYRRALLGERGLPFAGNDRIPRLVFDIETYALEDAVSYVDPQR
jgi:hypothetical protein